MNPYGPHLLPQHAALLLASGISPEVAEARRYRSIERKADLERKGFGKTQRNVPGLLLPVWNVNAECSTYQFRPDEPRMANGKAVKYETPHGSRMVLDVPPPVRDKLGDPKVPLFITEGIRKADAAVSKGLCCIALLGVWGWRGRNDNGGRTALQDWEQIALNDRQVYIAFDSDVMTKSEVHKALARLKPFLEGRGATVALIYVPPGDGGIKVGLDDYLAGHSVDDLLALAKPLAEPKESEPKAVYVPGFVLADGTIGEMVIDPLISERSFVVRHPDGATATVDEYTAGRITYRPMVDGLAGETVRFGPEVAPYGSLHSLSIAVKEFIHRYVELPAPYEAIAALYILFTWVYDAVPTTPYLRALGDWGRGKSRFLEVVGAIVFRAIRAAGATTPSPIFRILDRYRGTLVLDEADFSRSDAMAEVVKILNSGYKRGSPVLRSEPTSDRKWEPRSYQVFGPKIIATRHRFSDKALESRCLTWEAEGLTRDDIPLVLGSRFEAEAAALRAQLLAFRLDYLPTVARFDLEKVMPDITLEPRLQEIILPLCKLAGGDEELRSTLNDFLKAMQDEISADRRNSLPALILEAVLELHKEEHAELSPQAIAERLNAGDAVKEHLDKPDLGITPRRVGAILRGPLGLKMGQSSTTRRSVVTWDERRIQLLARQYGLTCIPPDEASEASDTSGPNMDGGSGHQDNASESSPNASEEAAKLHPHLNSEQAEGEAFEASEASTKGTGSRCCPTCGSTSFWHRRDGSGPVCSWCHPPPGHPTLVDRR